MDGYYGGNTALCEPSRDVGVDNPRPILAQLKMKRDRMVDNLKTLENAIAMLEQHPEFADFTDIMGKVGRI
jgi:hypothetical protein